MKKSTYISIVCVLVTFAVFVVLHSSRYDNSIEVTAMYSGNPLIIPIQNRQDRYTEFMNAGGASFTTRISLPEIIRKLENETMVSGRVVSSKILEFPSVIGALVTVRNDMHTSDMFWLYMTSRNGFKISTLRAKYVVDEFAQSAEPYILLPLHLISDTRIYGILDPTVHQGMEYRLHDDSIDAEAFYAFYEKAGWYNVKLLDKRIVISGFADKTSRQTSRLQFPLEISFEEYAGSTYMKIEGTM